MSLGKKLLQAASGVGGVEETDADFESTVLLLNADGASDGGQNNTFLDSSSNAHTITRNGNVTQGSFSPFSVDDGKWGNYFDGASDYLSVSNSGGDFSVTSSFSVEAWFYMTVAPTNATTGAHCIVSHWDGTSDPRAWFIDTGDSLDFRVFVYDSGGNPLVTQTGVGSFNLNQWTHVALTWDGSNYRFFVDGSLIFTVASSTAPNPATSKNIIIGYNANTHYFPGYISNVRITVDNGAQYTSAFTPSTTPLEDISGTSLLTCQSNRFVDNSSNAHTITPNGDVKVVPFSPFPQTTAYNASTNGGSGYFDGTGDYLTAPANSAFNFGTGDFTIEAWVYKTAGGGGIWSNGPTSSGSFGFYMQGTSELRCDYYGGTSLIGTTQMPDNAWHHVAVSRNGSDLSLYINGVRDNTTTTSSNNTTNSFAIGRSWTNFATGEITGYISNLRIIKGTAIYTGTSYTVPTTPLTDVTNTSFLGNFTNASIKDATGKNVLETIGNAQVNTTTVKYGTGAMEFGNGNRLESAPNIIYSPEAGDFTIEAWLYNQGYAGSQYGRGWCTLYGPSSIRLLLRLDNSTDKFNLFLTTTGSNTPFGGSGTTSTGTCTLNTWVHAAFVRESGTFKFYIDGTLDTTISGVTDSLSGFDRVKVGASTDGSTPEWNGFIDDLRITKGIARYTANFTPPERALPVIGE